MLSLPYGLWWLLGVLLFGVGFCHVGFGLEIPWLVIFVPLYLYSLWLTYSNWQQLLSSKPSLTSSESHINDITEDVTHNCKLCASFQYQAGHIWHLPSSGNRFLISHQFDRHKSLLPSTSLFPRVTVLVDGGHGVTLNYLAKSWAKRNL